MSDQNLQTNPQYKRMIRMGFSPDEAAMAVYGTPADTAAAVADTGVTGAIPVEPTERQLMAADLASIAEQNQIKVSAARIADDLPPGLDEAPGAEPKEPGSWVRSMNAIHQRNRTFVAITEGAREGLAHTATRLMKWLQNPSDLKEYVAGRSLEPAQMIAGAAFPFIGIQQAWFALNSGEPIPVAMARLSPQHMVTDDDGTTREKSAIGMWLEGVKSIASSIAQGTPGPLMMHMIPGPVGSVAAAGERVVKGVGNAFKPLGEHVVDYMMTDGFLWGSDVREAWQAGYGTFGAMQEGQQSVGGRWDTKVFSEDPEERAKEWAAVRERGDNFYAAILEQGGPVFGNAALMSLSMLDTAQEILNDPSIVFATTPRASVTGLRAGMTVRHPLHSSRVLGRIAQRTGNYPDVANYLRAAARAVDDEAARYAGKSTEENALRLVQAKAMLEEAESMTKNLVRHPVDAVVLAGAEAADVAPATAGKALDVITIPAVPKPSVLRSSSPPTGPIRTSGQAVSNRIASVFADERSQFRYADAVAVFGLEDDHAIRQHAILRGIRNNIEAGAREGLSESSLRQWESVYETIRNAAPEDVPGLVTRYLHHQVGPINLDDLGRISYQNRHGDTIFQKLGLSESDAWRRSALGPDDSEFNAIVSEGLLHGVSVDQLQVRYRSVPTVQAALATRMHGVTDLGMIDYEAINVHNRAVVRAANDRRTRRINNLKSSTTGYDLGKDGGLIRVGHGAQRATASGKDPKIQFMPKDVRKQLLDDLTELRTLQAEGPRIAHKFDWDMFGRSPTEKSPIPADWEMSLKDRGISLMARGLYPETWWPTTAAILRPIAYLPREPGRAISAVYPRMWTRIRNGLYARDFERRRMVRLVSDMLDESGAYEPVLALSAEGGVFPKQLPTGAVKLKDKALNNQIVEALDTPARIFNEAGEVVDNPAFFNLVDALPENARNSVRRLRQTMDYYAQKQGVRETDMYLTGYISHMFDGRPGYELLQEISYENPKAVLTIKHLLDRTGVDLGGDMVFDLAQIMDAYAAGMSRKMHMEPLYKDLQSMTQEYLRKEGRQGDWLVGEVNRVTRILKNEPSVLGRHVDNMSMAFTERLRSMGANVTHRPGDAGRMLMGLTNTVYAGLLTGNPRYLPMQLATGLATTSAEYGFAPTMMHALSAASPEAQALARAAGVDRQFKQVFESTSMRQLSDIASNWHVGTLSINMSEFYIRGITMTAAIDDAMRRMGFATMDEAVKAGHLPALMQHGVRMSEEVNHMFGVLGKPSSLPRISKSLGVAATQFLSFFPKQTEQLLATTLRNPGAFVEYMAVSGLIQRIAVMELGVDMSQYVGLGFRPDNVGDASQSAGVEVLGLMAQFFGMGAAAMAGFDVDLVEYHKLGERTMEAMSRIAPLATFYQSRYAGVTAAVNMIADGEEAEMEKRDARGGLVRMRDLSIGSRTREDVALLSGLPSVLDSIDRERAERMRRVDDEKVLNLYQLTQAYKSAEGRGDLDEMFRLFEQIADEGGLARGTSMTGRGMASSIKNTETVYMLEQSLRDAMSDKGTAVTKWGETADLDKLEAWLKTQGRGGR